MRNKALEPARAGMVCVMIFLIILLAGCGQNSAKIGVETGTTPDSPDVPAQLLAFPGAEGFGKDVTGGRGGKVYYVTTLEDYASGEPEIQGSLRYGIERFGITNNRREPVTILFAVSGNIILKRELRIRQGNLTIAGQSAPGGGICVGGYSMVINSNADNIIVRFIRVRMGDLYDVNADGADAFWGRRARNVIIDHCSMSWSTDECASFYGNTNFTMQWCIISESLNESLHSKGAHGYGGIWGGMKASFHHNLMAHHNSRMPRLGPDPQNSTTENELTDMRNNVFYNYNGEGCYGAEGMNVNIVNNYYIPGPANTYALNSAKRGRIAAIDKNTDNPSLAYYNKWGTFFIEGNFMEGRPDVTADNWTYGVYNQFHSSYGAVSQEDKDAMRLSEPLDSGTVTTHSVQDALTLIFYFGGCSLRRDSIDERIIDETRFRKTTFKGGKSGRSGIIDSVLDLKPEGAGDDWLPWPELEPGTPVVDSDGDGIPDGWLEANYPGKTSNDLTPEGYTLLEVYLNGLVKHIIGAGDFGLAARETSCCW